MVVTNEEVIQGPMGKTEGENRENGKQKTENRKRGKQDTHKYHQKRKRENRTPINIIKEEKQKNRKTEKQDTHKYNKIGHPQISSIKVKR